MIIVIYLLSVSPHPGVSKAVLEAAGPTVEAECLSLGKKTKQKHKTTSVQCYFFGQMVLISAGH